jgi:hypothetical protein
MPNMTLNENPFSRSQVVTCGQTDKWTEMVKLIGAFLQLFIANAPKRINTAILTSISLTVK